MSQTGPQPGEVLQLFQDTGAYLTGHFRLTSGKHSPNYLQSALVLQHPEHAQTLGRQLAAGLQKLAGPRKIDLVLAPALGGLIIGHEVARALGVPFQFTERDSDRKMSLRRGFTIPVGAGVVVVEDVISTGGSTREVIDILEERGVTVLGAGSIIDRSGGRANVGAPRVALETLQVVAYDPESCPMCAAGGVAEKPGSRPV